MENRFDYFVVFAEMRTGSNFLEANLNALDGVTCHGEAFNPAFLGYPKTTQILGVTLAAREENPLQLVGAMKADKTLMGFRYFHNHDPRILEAVLDDPRCAKIVLTRNPAESYVSLKIAQSTGQWLLTDAKNRKAGKAVFEAEEFEAHVQNLQRFQCQLLAHLQKTGQSAFYVGYEDLQDIEIMNGLARFLGVPARLEALDKKLKVQNPEPLSAKVSNFEVMERALAGEDRFNLTRTPNFEPRRTAAVPSYVVNAEPPLIFLPVPGGPNAAIVEWMDQISTDDEGPAAGLTQKLLRQWKRRNPRHRSFTVLRHPLARAYHIFCSKILSTDAGSFPQIRAALIRNYKVDLPEGPVGPDWSIDQQRAAFASFLVFLKANLAGQTSIRVDGCWATQSATIQGFGNFMLPDLVLREGEHIEQLGQLAKRLGSVDRLQPETRDEGNPFTLDEIYTDTLEDLAQDAYQRDYMMFGFSDWREA